MKTCPAPGPVDYLVVVVAGFVKNIGADELSQGLPPRSTARELLFSEGGGVKLEISFTVPPAWSG